MKTNKRAVFFLFLCMMGALMLTMTSSQSLLPNDSIVYAEEGEEEEIEENAPAPVTNSNGNYGNLQIPAMLSTAYADGLRQAQQSNDDSDAETFTSNVHAIMTFDSYFDRDGNYYSEEGRFDTLGVLIGPVGQASGSGTNDVASTLSVGLDELKNNYSFDNNLGEAYWTFGRAVQNLRLDAESSDTSTIGATSAVNAFSGISRHVTNIGVQLLKNWSPAPIVLAFTDHTVLRDPQYATNHLVRTVGNVEALTTLINAFGSPVPMYPRISYSQLIMIVMIMLGLAVSILTIFMGKSFFPVSMKKTLVKVLIMIVAVPLTMRVYDWGLEKLDEVTNDEVHTTEYQLARHHLLLGMWAEKGFALPTDMALTVSDGRFVLSREDIRKINGMVLGTNDDVVIADEIRRQVNSDNNESHISWQAVLTETDGAVDGTLWRTNTVLEMATALGNNEPIEVPNAGYVYSSGLRSNRSAQGHFVYRQTGRYGSISEYTRYGMGPVSTYNLLNTSFNGNGLSVRSNLSTGTTVPSVAPTAYAYTGATVGAATPDSDDVNMSGILKWFVEFSLLVASIKALAKIISFGFGGMIHGGARSMFGSSAGWGELLGAIFATIFGVMGLSFFSLVTFEVANSLYGTMHGMINGIIQDSTVLTIISKFIGTLVSPKGIIGLLPFVSDPIAAWAEEGVVSIVATILALFLLPKFIRIPIEAFAGWVSSLPSAWADKAQRIENRFTGDTLGGSTSSGALAGAMQKAGDSMVSSGTAVAAGAGMIAGAGIKAGGGAILGRKKDKDGVGDKKKDSGKDDGGKDDGGSDSIAATAGGMPGGGADDPKTDANGNPITENITDNEGSTEDTQIADETNEEGEVNAEESAEVSENNTEGDMTGDNVNGEEAMISDENSNMTEAASDNINAGDESIADGVDSIGGGYGVDADGNLVNGDGEAITDSDGNNIQPKLNEDGQLDSASANANGHMLNDSGDVARDADGNPIPIFQPGEGNGNDNPTDAGDATNGNITEGSINEGELSQDVSVNDEHTQGDVNADESSTNTDSRANTSTATDGTSSNQSSLNVGGTSSESIASGGVSSSESNINSNATSGGNVNTSEASSGDSIASSSGDVSTNDTRSGDTVSGGNVNTSEASSGDSIASSSGDVNTNDARSGDTVSGGNVNTSDEISGGSIASSSGDVNTNDARSGDSIASSSGDVSTNDARSGDTVSGGEVNTSDEISGGSIASSGDNVNTSQATSGGDVNSSQVNAGSEAGGTTGTTESGVHSDSHSESTMGGQTSESGQVSGASVSSNSTMEGSQVTHDASQNNANVTTDSNAQVNQSSEERTTNQGDNADNSQRADVKSNAQTVNDNQSRNTSIGGSQGSPTTGSPRVSAGGGQSSAKPSTQGGTKVASKPSTGGQSSAKPSTQGGQSSAKPTSQGGTKVASKPSTGGQSSAKPSSSGTQTGAKPQPSSGAKISATGGPNTTPSSGAKVSATGGTRVASSSNNRRPNLSSIVGGRNAGGQTRRPSATIGKDGSIASNNPRQSAGQGAQNTQKPSGNENTSQKASRISDKVGRGSAQQGGVSNAQQAAMGAVHMLGGLTGMEGITQQGVNSLHRKQGRKVNNKETSKTPNQSQNPTQNDRDREQQIIDMERRREEEQSKRVKKPSFITQARDKGKNDKR